MPTEKVSMAFTVDEWYTIHSALVVQEYEYGDEEAKELRLHIEENLNK